MTPEKEMGHLQLIATGAEATIHADNCTVIKTRLSKPYRHPSIDASIRKSRTRREAKILDALQQLSFPCPQVIAVDEAAMTISMSLLSGKKLADVLESDPLLFSSEIGRNIALLHQHDMVHGDLTTSNMIVNAADGRVYFIDFGLSQFSKRVEDKAVDLHLLQRALDSKHSVVAKECFDAALAAYRAAYPDAPAVLERLQAVELRGRNRAKKGS